MIDASPKEQEANSSSSFFWFIKTKLSIPPTPASFLVIIWIGSYKREDLDLDQITMKLSLWKEEETFAKTDHALVTLELKLNPPDERGKGFLKLFATDIVTKEAKLWIINALVAAEWDIPDRWNPHLT